jgi:hypothetical protein
VRSELEKLVFSASQLRNSFKRSFYMISIKLFLFSRALSRFSLKIALEGLLYGPKKGR